MIRLPDPPLARSAPMPAERPKPAQPPQAKPTNEAASGGIANSGTMGNLQAGSGKQTNIGKIRAKRVIINAGAERQVTPLSSPHEYVNVGAAWPAGGGVAPRCAPLARSAPLR